MAHRRWMAWAALGAAFLAFELAVDLSITLPLACLLFGWNDAATAWWCVRRDPIRLRGWLAAGLYGASALLKVGLGAFAGLIAVGAIAGAVEGRDRSAIGPAEGEPPAFVLGMVFVAVGSLMAAWGLANLTCGAALWMRRRLWLGPEPGLARGQGVWPPWAADVSRLDRPAPTNRIKLIVWLAVIPWISVLILVEFLGVGLLANLVGGPGVATVAGVGVMLISIVAVPVLALRRLDGRLAAASPFEAWELEAP